MGSRLSSTVDAPRNAAYRRTPDRIAYDLADEVVELGEIVGITLDPWQRDDLAPIVSYRADGRPAAFESCEIVARQNGKNVLLELRELGGLACVLPPDDLILHTAHRDDAVDTAFLRMQRFVEEIPEIARRVKHVSKVNGKKYIEFYGPTKATRLTETAYIRYVPRAREPGRSFTGSLVVFDEAFDLKPAQIGSSVPTLSTRPGAQIIYASSSPKPTSTVLHSVMRRGRGLTGEDEPNLAYVEYCNDPGTDLADEDAWFRSNPSLGIVRPDGTGITIDYVRNEYRLMAAGGDPELEDEFARERVGIGDLPVEADGDGLDYDLWLSAAESTSRIASDRSWGFAVSDDRRSAAIGVAGLREDGRLHVEFMESRSGTGWLVDRIARGWEDRRIPIRCAASHAPTASFVDTLRKRGVEVEEVTSTRVKRATARIVLSVAEDGLRHLGQRVLDASVRGAFLATTESGSIGWKPSRSRSDVTPLAACTVAVDGVDEVEEYRPPAEEQIW